MSEPLNPAELAAREVLSEWEVFTASDGNQSIRMRKGRSEDETARAVVAAVRPLIEHEAAGKALLAAASHVGTVVDSLTITNGANSTIKGLERAKSIIHSRAEREAKTHLAALEGEQDHA